MLPKKIYLNYVDEADENKTWSEEPISVYDCKMQNREYADLSQVWHDASEEPLLEDKEIIFLTEQNIAYISVRFKSGTFSYMLEDFYWERYVNLLKISKWAYISDLLPKGNKK